MITIYYTIASSIWIYASTLNEHVYGQMPHNFLA